MTVLITIAFFAGVALIAYGAWLAWHPAGFMAAGLSLVLIAVSYVRGSWASSTG